MLFRNTLKFLKPDTRITFYCILIYIRNIKHKLLIICKLHTFPKHSCGNALSAVFFSYGYKFYVSGCDRICKLLFKFFFQNESSNHSLKEPKLFLQRYFFYSCGSAIAIRNRQHSRNISLNIRHIKSFHMQSRCDSIRHFLIILA